MAKISPEERAQLEQELFRRAMAKITPELLAGDHAKQCAMLKSKARNMLLMCSRRAGKTHFNCRLLILVSLAIPNVSSLYLGIVGPAAKKVWSRIWKPLLRRLAIPCEHNEADMQTVFPNESVVQFGGIDDARHVASLLGDSMAGGIAIIDECQSQPAAIQETVEDILEPMLSETTAEKPVPGRLLMSGTIPKIKAGYFWELWSNGLADGKIANDSDSEWERHNFSRFDNPYLTNNREALRNTLAKFKWTEDHPTIQRDWYGRWDVQDEVTAIHYSRARSGWTPEPLPHQDSDMLRPGTLIAGVPPDGINRFGIGIDPAATADRFMVQLVGWEAGKQGLWHVAEWATERKADALESQWMAVIMWMKERYGKIVRVIRDAGSAATTNDLLYQSHGIIIEPAIKGGGSRKARVDRLDDLVASGVFRCIVGSKLEEDFQRATWSVKARAAGKWEWDSSWHPDALDAASYIVPAYAEAPGTRVQVQGAALPPDIAAHNEAEKAFKQQFTDYKAPARGTRPARDSRSLYRR